MSAIQFTNLSFSYQAGTPFAVEALRNVSVTIPNGSWTAVIGHTGSGKSTLMQLLDGLLSPTTGSIRNGQRQLQAGANRKEMAAFRQQTGFVFQFPENQLFAETVLEDVMFGPQNLGRTDKEARTDAIVALEMVHFPREDYKRSPFDLSGGQMRRVAIAGVLAMRPQTLILDEPTAGLDPSGQDELMRLIKTLHDQHRTILMVTHQMELVGAYADHVLVMNHGQMTMFGTPQQLFAQPQLLSDNHLKMPASVALGQQLRAKGLPLPETLPLTIEQLASEVAETLRRKQG